MLGRLFQRDGMSTYRRGILHFNRGEYQEAIADFEATLAGIGDPQDPYFALGRFYAAEAHAKLGLAYEGLGDREQAAAEFEKAIGCGYHYPDLHVHLAAILDSQGNDLGAEAECRTALERNPEYHDARARLLIALANQGRASEASDELARLLASSYPVPTMSDPANPRVDAPLVEGLRAIVSERRRGHARLARALESYDRGDRDTAIAELKSAVRDQPRYADLRCRLGALLLESGRIREGLAEIEHAIDINRDYVEARLQAGIANLRLGAPEDAILHLRIAYELEPEHPDVCLFFGVANLRTGDFEEASRILEEALEASPIFHRARYCLGLVRLAQGRTQEAIGMIMEASEGEPALAHAQIDLGFLKVRHGSPEVAVTMFREVLKRDPADVEARLGLGLALESSGRRGDARPEFLKVLLVDPKSITALTALTRIDIAEGRFAEAGTWCDRAIDETPRDVALLVFRGAAWTGIGEHEKAKSAYESALAQQPDHAEARVGLALSLFHLQRRIAGRAEMENVFRADPANPIARVFADERLIEGL
jgi:tetratricopeptide (TPR) repeat protein